MSENTQKPTITQDSNNATAFGIYLNEIGRKNHNPLSIEEEVSLYTKAKMGDEKAINKLVSANLRFVISFAKKYQGRGLNLSDLIQEGNLGLVKAIKPFDETRGFKFYSYAVRWMKESITKSLDENSRIVRLPQNQISSIGKKMREPILDEELEECEDLSLLSTLRSSHAEAAFERHYVPIGVKSDYDDQKPFDIGYEDEKILYNVHKDDIRSFVYSQILPLLKEEAQSAVIKWANDEELTHEEMELKNRALEKLRKKTSKDKKFKQKIFEYLSN